MSETQSYFSITTKGTLTAEFILDNDNKPIFSQSGKYKNYKIIYRLKSERADEIEKVVYLLDSSYYNPIRESKDSKNDFELKTTTYGEYSVSIEVYFKDGVESARDNFSVTKLLRQYYELTNNQSITEAIDYISEN